jgi:hypothetical protein
MSKKNSQLWFEIAAVFLTGSGKFIFFEILNLQFWYIMIVSFFWLGYLVFNLMKNKERITYWGFKKDGFCESLMLILPLASIALAIIITYGALAGSMLLNWHIFPSLLLYPLWGLAQQYIILALVAGNLQEIKSPKIPKFVILLCTATLFCLVHYPNYMLMGGTFILAIVYTIVYLRFRNLWVLGIVHGWLGSFFYYFVLGKDAWAIFINSI